MPEPEAGCEFAFGPEGVYFLVRGLSIWDRVGSELTEWLDYDELFIYNAACRSDPAEVRRRLDAAP